MSRKRLPYLARTVRGEDGVLQLRGEDGVVLHVVLVAVQQQRRRLIRDEKDMVESSRNQCKPLLGFSLRLIA